MSNTFDEFAGDAGLKSDYDGVITHAEFGIDPQYNGGATTLLKLTIQDDDGEEVVQMYPCGSGWDSVDGGETIEHDRGKRSINNRTALFKLLKAAMDAGADDVLRERSARQFGKLGPRAAGIWTGLRFHWDAVTETYSFKDRSTGEEKTGESVRIVPTKYLGAAGKAEAAGGQIGVDAELMEKLAKVAEEAKDFNGFLDAAMEVPGVLGNAKAMSLIAQEGTYDKLKKGQVA
ncbi:MAG: hypothetical protein M0008_09815 [Actinomycetota bacterium]|nr:hypothetical protein [Actinomycetota bacterium]